MKSLLHTLQFDDYEDDSPSVSASLLLEIDKIAELSINSQTEKVKTLDYDEVTTPSLYQYCLILKLPHMKYSS